MRIAYQLLVILIISGSVYGATSNVPKLLNAPSPMVMGDLPSQVQDHDAQLFDNYDMFPYPPNFPDELKGIGLCPCICAYGLLRIMYDEIRNCMEKAKQE